jgi:hypothetical protein
LRAENDGTRRAYVTYMMKLRIGSGAIVLFVACSGPQASDDGGADAQPEDATTEAAPSDASNDTGANDAGSGDSGAGGPSKCGGSSYRLCDGFEGSSIDTTLWAAPILNNATVKIDSTHVARGKSALYVHTGLADAGDPAGTVGNLHTTHNFPFPNDDLWGRVFVYMAGQSPDMHTNMIEAVGLLPGDAGESHYRIGVSTAHVIAGNYIPGDYADHSTTVMPLDQWACFEWHFDGVHDEYHFYLNGSELTDMAILSDASPSWIAPPFAYLEMGLRLYHPLVNEPTLDVWYDEVALDTARITCGN